MDSPLPVEDALGLLLDEQVPWGDAVSSGGQGGPAGAAGGAWHACKAVVVFGGSTAWLMVDFAMVVVWL